MLQIRIYVNIRLLYIKSGIAHPLISSRMSTKTGVNLSRLAKRRIGLRAR
jgi:hypothetical protein